MSIIDVDLIKSYEDKKLIQFLYENFCVSLPEKLKLIERLGPNSKALEKTNILHSIKNLFANVGARVPARLCQDMEDEVQVNSRLDIKVRVPELRGHFVATRDELRKLIEVLDN